MELGLVELELLRWIGGLTNSLPVASARIFKAPEMNEKPNGIKDEAQQIHGLAREERRLGEAWLENDEDEFEDLI